ncbi:MAG: Crp/Fnr family transcriptional regulator [Ignavibacteria bacterium]|nr:Crp/Fnr family transcriptional regulator [Ignavibacteria bacterium]
MDERNNNLSKPAPWDLLYSSDSRIYLPSNADLVQPTDIITKVYLVEKGALAETKADSEYTSHLVALCGPNSIIGIPYSGDDRAVYGIRATALTSSTLLVANRDEFIEATHANGELTRLVLMELARRTVSVARLTDACQHESTTRHVLGLLEHIATTFQNGNGTESSITVPPQILERMSGCPWVMVRSAIGELAEKGLVVLGPDGVKLARVFTA